ncbi:MAG: hypothetical protein S4CHLAM6_04760 [Chlamydiae bacterium]|nr:hypothetical protein [Chlamydiota bacterium]
MSLLCCCLPCPSSHGDESFQPFLQTKPKSEQHPTSSQPSILILKPLGTPDERQFDKPPTFSQFNFATLDFFIRDQSGTHLALEMDDATNPPKLIPAKTVFHRDQQTVLENDICVLKSCKSPSEPAKNSFAGQLSMKLLPDETIRVEAIFNLHFNKDCCVETRIEGVTSEHFVNHDELYYSLKLDPPVSLFSQQKDLRLRSIRFCRPCTASCSS